MTGSRRAAAVVLAAGSGSRLGRPKALLEVDGRRLVDRAVSVVRAAGCAPVVVVAGAVPLDVPGALVVDNAGWSGGMASSLATGLAALGDDVDAALVMLVDQPGIGRAVVARLLEASGEAVVATYGGRRRNPVVLARSCWAEVVATATGDEGARRFLAAHPELVTEVECGDVGDPADVDTREDLARWTAAAGSPE